MRFYTLCITPQNKWPTWPREMEMETSALSLAARLVCQSPQQWQKQGASRKLSTQSTSQGDTPNVSTSEKLACKRRMSISARPHWSNLNLLAASSFQAPADGLHFRARHPSIQLIPYLQQPYVAAADGKIGRILRRVIAVWSDDSTGSRPSSSFQHRCCLLRTVQRGALPQQ